MIYVFLNIDGVLNTQDEGKRIFKDVSMVCVRRMAEVLNKFKNIHVNKFKILSSNDMKLDPTILELDDVKVSIYKNKSNYDDIMHNKIYIYNDMYEK